MSNGPQPPNPYAADAGTSASVVESNLQLPPGQQRGMISQVPILGVLMIIQGIVDLLMAAGCIGYAFFMPEFIRQMQEQAAKQGGQGPPLPPQAASWMFYGMVFIAVLAFVVGAMTIYSGTNVMRFRGRTSAIVSLGLGLSMIATCYCFPTSLALAIYGLITLLNPSVNLGFELRKQGRTALDIQRSFALLP